MTLNMKLCISLLLCTTALMGRALPSQTVKQGEILKRSYFFEEAKKHIDYALYVPKSYNKTRKIPLLVLLHGLGSNPDQVIRYKGLIQQAERRGYILTAPYGYNERGWYGSRGKGKPRTIVERKKDPENLGELSEKDVLNVMEIVLSEFTIDEDRIYLLGHSMGGGGALHLGATYPDLWAGLACLSPAYYGALSKLEKLKRIPVIVASGENDALVPIENVRRLVDKMKTLKMDYHYKEIQGGRHFLTITRNPEMIAEVFDFLDKRKRKGTKKLSEQDGADQPATAVKSKVE
jgi:predicted peptidase